MMSLKETLDHSSVSLKKKRMFSRQVLHPTPWYIRLTWIIVQVGEALQADILPNAIDYLSGRGENSIRDFDFDDDELDEDEEDDAASVDLEDEEDQPKKKKTKV